MTDRHLKAGELIFREGEESDKAYIVRSGKVEIFKRIDHGTLLLATLGPNEIFGEMGLLSDQPRAAYAAAVVDTVISEVEREAFCRLIAQQPEEIALMMRALSERLREVNQKVTKLMNKQAQFQLASPNAAPPVTRIMISPLTGFLKNKMPPNGVNTTTLPFRVGGLPAGAEPNPLDWNNLFIQDVDNAIISRNHFAIQRGPEGVYVSDRGSRTGTIVNEERIGGGEEHFQKLLKFGDNVVVAGTDDSPYRFCVTWE